MAMQAQSAVLYPEEYIIEEDLSDMGEINPHTRLIDRLAELLTWRFRLEGFLVLKDMDLMHPAIRNSGHYIVPDVMLIKITLSPEDEQALERWDATRQPPSVVFEVSSKSTWRHDVESQSHYKPAIYGRIGVKEYFAYDPQHPQVWRPRSPRRLRGWRYDENGQATELSLDDQGRMYSQELGCYLVEDGYFLQFVDEDGQPLLTEREAAQLAQLEAQAQIQQAENKLEQAQAQAQQVESKLEVTEAQLQQMASQLQQVEQQRYEAEARSRQVEERLAQEARLRQELEQRLAEFLKQHPEAQ